MLYFAKGFKGRDRCPLSVPPLGHILATLFVTPTFKSVNEVLNTLLLSFK